MFRDRLARLGFPRRIDRWIDPLELADAVGRPEGLRENSQAAVSWLSDYFVALHPGGTKSEYVHEILEPLDALRVPEFEETGVFHAARTARFAVFAAHRYEGGTRRIKARVDRVPPTIAPGPDGEPICVEGRNVRFRNARVGDVLELRYARDFVLCPDQGPFTWDHMFLWILPYPCARRRVTIAVHESLEHEVRAHNFDLDAEEWSDRGYRFRRWTAVELPGVEAEDCQPPPRDFAPWIDVSTCKDWGPIAGWLEKHLVTSTESSQEIRDILAEHAPADLDLRTRAARCFDYCRDQVVYGRLHQVGPEEDAQPSDLVAATRRGDCKDQTSLLRGLLTEVGVSCRPAAVVAGDPSRIGFLPSQRFDHVILAGEVGGETLWLDPTAVHVVFGGVVPDLEGTRALLLDGDGQFGFATIRHTSAEQNTFSYRATGGFEGRDLVVDLTVAYSGRFACMLRASELHAQKSITRALQAVASERLGSCTVEAIGLRGDWRRRDPIEASARIRVPNWIKTAGAELRLLKFPWLGAHISPRAVASVDRQREYVTGGPCRAEYSLELSLPEGRSLDHAGGTREFHGPGHLATITTATKPGVLELRVVLETRVDRLPTAEYPAFRDFVHEYCGFFEDQHVLTG